MRHAAARSVRNVVGLVGCVVAGALQAAPITNLFFFGDSLTDMGNAALVNSPPGANSSSSPPARSPVPYPAVGADGYVYTPVYVPPWTRPYETTGRFTDGFTWAAAFASALGFPGAAAPSLAGGNNYAIGGATVVPRASPPVPPPSAAEQLAAFRASHGGVTGTFDPTALYFIGAGGNDLRVQRLHLTQRARVVQRLAPLHLLHQEGRRHRRVVLRIDTMARQLAQVGGALERVLQALVGLVDAHRPLHRHALGGRPLGGEAVRVHLGLQRAPALVQHAALLAEAARQAEQGEVVVFELHASFFS